MPVTASGRDVIKMQLDCHKCAMYRDYGAFPEGGGDCESRPFDKGDYP